MAYRNTAQQKEEVKLTSLYAKESEHVIIAGLLLNAEAHMVTVNKFIKSEEAFSVHLFQQIYLAIKDLLAKGQVVDFTTISSYHPDILTTVSLADIITNVPETRWNSMDLRPEIVENNCKVVRECYLKRQIVQRLESKDDLSEVMKLVGEWEVSGRDKLFDPAALSELLIHTMQSPSEGNILYPWKTFNRSFGGISKGQLVLVCARPGTGKSIFCENVASFAATTQGKRVLFASCEMSALDIVKRIATRRKGLRLFNRVEPFDESEMVEIFSVAQDIRQSGLFIHELTSVPELEAVIKNNNREFDLVVVDYIQRLRPRQKTNSLYERATYTSNELADLALRYHIPILAACQFNRNAERNQPTLADLRDSGSLEQDAFTVFSLWTEKEDDKSKPEIPIFVDVLKNRNGVMMGNYGDSKFYLTAERRLFKFKDPQGII